MRNVRLIIFWWGLTLLWLGVIYYFSNQPNLKSEFQPVWDLIFRKIAHVSEFFVLSYLFFKSFAALGISKIKSLVLAVVFSIFSAVFDEWHQSFVTGRVPSIIDIIVDSVGVLGFSVLQLNYLRR